MIARELMGGVSCVFGPKDDLVSAGSLMYEKKVSSAVVEEDDKVIGILSKGGVTSLAKKLCKEGGAGGLTVGDVMDKKFEVASPDSDLQSVLSKFMSLPYRITIIPVVEGGRVVGEIPKTRLVRLYAETMRGKFKVGQLMEYKPCFVYDYTPLLSVIKEIEASSEKRVLVKRGYEVVGIVTILDVAVELFESAKSGVCKARLSSVKAGDIMTENLTKIGVKEDAAKAADIMLEKAIGGIPVEKTDIEGIITKTNLIKGLLMKESKISS